MAVTDGVVMSHVGICVSDYEKSLRFYTEGLGFELAEAWPAGNAFAPLAEVSPPMKGRVQIIRRGATRLEIIGWTTPAAEGTPLRRRNQNGLTHLSFYVVNLDAVAKHLISLGATLLENTRMHIDQPTGTMDMVFLADPDGTRIELVQDTTKPFPPF